MRVRQSESDPHMETQSPNFLLCWSTAVSLNPLSVVNSISSPGRSHSVIDSSATSFLPSTPLSFKYSLKPFIRPVHPHFATTATTHPKPVMTISFNDITDLRKKQRTARYKTSGLIVRRGFSLQFQTTSSRLTITLVPAHPSNKVDLKYSFTLEDGKEWNGWTLQKQDGGKTAKLSVPVNAVVGLYSVQDDNSKVPMAVLFNPYTEEDTVYMADDNEREEYVMNQTGRIWRGSHSSLSGMPWNHSQFRPVVMFAAIDLIDSLDIDRRHDPIYVSRHLSAMMNSGNEDNGVLVGRWHGDYSDGIAPTAWTGSHEILKQYWQERRPVKYGQCWVYSGVFTSVLRALGIPACSVTNFDSAHEVGKPYKRIVERYYSATGEVQDEKNEDSIWNFHVWNMAWMQRPDLANKSKEHGLDYNGWQVLDGTPQESSMGLYQLGPGPLIAIKHGYEVDFDTDFVIAEVNADLVNYWEDKSNGKYLPRDKYERHVGKAISTKLVARDARNDITLLYKFKEGSAEERKSLNNRPTGTVKPVTVQNWDVKFNTAWPVEVKVGEAAVFAIKVTNNTSKPVTVNVNCAYSATDYTGYPLEKFGKYTEEVVVDASNNKEVVVRVPPELYVPKMKDGMQTIHLNCSAKVKESGQVWSEENIVRLNPDDVLQLAAPDSVDLGRSAVVTATIKNPLHVKLTGVVLRVEGEGLAKLQTIKLRDVEVGESYDVDVRIQGTDLGNKLLVATLDTIELMDVARSAHIDVNFLSGIGGIWKYLWGGGESEDMGELAAVEGR